MATTGYRKGLNKEITDACSSEDLSLVEALITDDFTKKDLANYLLLPSKQPVFHLAAACCNQALCQLLLDWGADVDVVDRQNMTALWRTAASNTADSHEMLKFLLSKGANPTHVAADGRSAFSQVSSILNTRS